MEETTQAFVFFWLAGLLLLVGVLLSFFSKSASQRLAGKLFMGAGFLSLIATPWTIPSSPSSAFGHFLGSIVGPCVLLGVGFYQIAFSGPVPVGRLSDTDRRLGFLMVVLGVLWLESMHWWVMTPTYPNEVNRYWMIFWPTLLLFGFATASAGYVVVGVVGDERHRERRLMLALGVFLLTLMAFGVTMDAPNVSNEAFTLELLLAGADLFGVLVGAAGAVLLFAFVLTIYEKQQPMPKRLPAPTSEQLHQAAEIIARHAAGGEEE